MTRGVPPDAIIRRAEEEAAQSPCAKSKRGVVVFDRVRLPAYPEVYAWGSNRPPGGLSCDGSVACRASCGKRCLHAEHVALHCMATSLVQEGDVTNAGHLEMVHVKIGTDGRVVPGGGPSCWQCAREVLDEAIAGVWLFEATDCPSEDCPMCSGAACNLCGAGCWNSGGANCDHAVEDRHHDAQPPQGEWKFYTAPEFWEATCRTCEVHP